MNWNSRNITIRTLCPGHIQLTFLIIGVVSILFTDITAQIRYSGLWEQGGAREKLWSDASESSFKAKQAEFAEEGYSLVDVEVKGGSAPTFSAVWHLASIPSHLAYDLSLEEFQQEWSRLGEQRMALVDFEVYETNGTLRYLGLWHPGDADQQMLNDVDWSQLKQTARRLVEDGFRLIDVETYTKNGTRQYMGLWEEGEGLELILGNLDGPSLEEVTREMIHNYMTIRDIESYQSKGATRFIGIWAESEVDQMLLTDVNWSVFLARWKDDRPTAMHLVDFESAGSTISAPPPATQPLASSNGSSSVRRQRRRPISPTVDNSTPTPSTTPATTPTTEPATNTSSRPRSQPQTNSGMNEQAGTEQEGMASYYGDKFQGRPTASGEPYDRNKRTAAHRTHKFGTILKVTNLENGKTVNVRVNDRGPFVPDRVVDLSGIAAEDIDMITKGVAKVKVVVVR